VKRTFSCLGDDNVEEWNNSGLRTWLGDAGQKTWLREEKKDVLLCGIEGHICVFQTCVDLLTRGHQVSRICFALSALLKRTNQRCMW
jgi:nicotinamidase-related amidase